jgi:hypothetical protein
MEGGAVMGQGYLRGQNGGRKLYTEADCSFSAQVLTLPSGIIWEAIDSMLVVGKYMSDYAYAAWCQKKPGDQKLYHMAAGSVNDITPASSATSITTPLNSLTSVLIIMK